MAFAKRRLVCRAKGNVPNVGRLSAFLYCGSTKKLNLFSVIVISFFILKPLFLSFSVSLSFLRLVGNGLQTGVYCRPSTLMSRYNFVRQLRLFVVMWRISFIVLHLPVQTFQCQKIYSPIYCKSNNTC